MNNLAPSCVMGWIRRWIGTISGVLGETIEFVDNEFGSCVPLWSTMWEVVIHPARVGRFYLFDLCVYLLNTYLCKYAK